MHLAAKSQAQHTGSQYTLYLPNDTRQQTTPNIACTGKDESIPVAQRGEMATREMVSHAQQPLERPVKQVSRVATLLERHYTSALTTLNVPSLRRMIAGRRRHANILSKLKTLSGEVSWMLYACFLF